MKKHLDFPMLRNEKGIKLTTFFPGLDLFFVSEVLSSLDFNIVRSL